MGKKDFNPLHVVHEGNNKGWAAAADPFSPYKTKAAHTFVRKHIYVLADQLFYDIDAVTGMLARIRSSELPDTFATAESDEYRPLFYRWLDKYVKKAEARMAAFILTPAHVTRTNELKEWEEKEIVLSMPDTWDDTVFEDLVNAVHRYISDGALYEYLSLTLTTKDAVTVERYSQMEEAYEDIKNYVCATKPHMVEKTLKPF